jgi:hypothetical protein
MTIQGSAYADDVATCRHGNADKMSLINMKLQHKNTINKLITRKQSIWKQHAI